MSAVPLPRPTRAQPPLQAVRHGPGQILIRGSGPGGLVISGLSGAEHTAVLALAPALLAGRPVTAPGLQRWSTVVAQVRSAVRALRPPPPLAGHVIVGGDGPLPLEIGQVLQRFVARVTVGQDAATPWEHHTDSTGGQPDLVVLPAVGGLSAHAGRTWQLRGVPHLPVVVGDRLLAVGPLIRADHGPCLRCLDLHRGERTPGYARWLIDRDAPGVDLPEVGADPELSATAAGLVALIVRGLAEGVPLPSGVSLSVRSPRPQVEHHLWPRHPACCDSAEVRETMGG